MTDKRLPLEERQAMGQLAKHPGWYVLMREYLLRTIDHESTIIDRPRRLSEATVNISRGRKALATELVATVYKLAELPNPLAKRSQTIVKMVRDFSGVKDPEAIVHWIIHGKGLCATEGTEPLRAARQPDHVTCPACKEVMEQAKPPSEPKKRQGVPV